MKNCPNCNRPLAPAEYEGFGILRCGQCRGHLVALSRLESIKRVARKTKEELKAEAAADFHGNKPERVKCPRCRMPMGKRAIRLPVLAVEMDVCLPCSLVWFDGGELALAQLGYEAGPGFADAQEMRRRMEALEASPERKAAFEKDLARLPDATDPVSGALDELAGEVLDSVLRGYVRNYGN